MHENHGARVDEWQRFRTALHHAPVILFTQDRDLRYTWVHNPVFGSTEDILGARDADLLPSGSAAVLTTVKKAVLESGEGARCEVRLETPAGVRYYDLTVEPTREPGGGITGIAGAALDITQRVELEQARVEGAERLSMAQKAAGLGIHDYNVATGVIRWDERVRELWGIGRDAPVTYDLFLSGLHPDDRQATQRAVDRALDPTSDGQYEAEYRVISRDDGVERWVRATGQVTFDGNRAVRLVGTVQEVTAQKRAEAEVRTSQERLRLALEAAATGLWTWDLSSQRVTWSPEVYAIHGLPSGEFDGTANGFFRLVHPADAERVRRTVTAAIEQRTRYECEFRIVQPDGAVRWVANVGRAVYDAAGRALSVTGTITDITPRKQAEEGRRASEGRLHAVFNQALVGIAETDLTGRFVQVNPRYCEIVGRPAEELYGLRMQDVTHPDDLALNLPLFERAVADGTPFVIEKRYLRPDGAVVWVSNSVSLVRGDGNRPAGVVAACLDITANKRAEVALRDSETHFRTMADYAPTMLWVTDATGQCTYLSSRWYDFTGTTPDESLGLGWLTCVHEADRQHASDVFLEANAERVPFSLDYRVRRRDGVYRWAVDAGQPRFGTGGEFLGFVGTVTDVHERQLAEQALRASEQRFRLAADAVNGIIYEYDVRTGRVERTRGLAEVVGFEPDEVPPTTDWWWERIHPEDRTAIEARCAVNTSERTMTEYRVQHRDGRWLHVQDRAVVLRDAAGEPLRIVGCTIDASDQKVAEEALRQADRRKDEFLATLAHELRNPLAPVRNAVRVLMAARDWPDPNMVWARELIDRQVSVMARLLDDLLDVSRITGDRMELRKELVDLVTVVATAVETSRPLIDAAGHDLVVDLPADTVVLDADPVRLAQVFANLLNNAAKYTDHGGHIRLAAERVGDEVVIAVSDDGIGIPADMMPRLFDIFTQAGPALERAQGGLGIGLALVRGLVVLHGGTVEARSDGPGLGSTFVVRLPLAVRAASVLGVPQQPESRAAGRRLLIADDRADSADTMAMLLQLTGHDVRTAYSGEDAIAVAEAFRPDVALIDLGMPRVSGYDVCRRIRQEPWGRQMCLVAVTGWGQEEDRRRTAEAGFDFHLVKPVDPDEVQQLLAACTAVPQLDDVRGEADTTLSDV